MKRITVFSLVAMSLALSAMFVHAANEETAYPDISIAELKKAIAEEKVVVLDANGTDSYERGHVPGAIDFETNHGKLADLLPKDNAALVVAYCGGPQCPLYKEAAGAATAMG